MLNRSGAGVWGVSLKRNSQRPVYSATGGSILSDREDVDFVLFMPGDHFEIVDEDEFEILSEDEALAEQDTVAHRISGQDDSWSREDAARARDQYESESSYNSIPYAILSDDDIYDEEEIEFIEVDTGPEPSLHDDDVTAVRQMPTGGEATWWQAAKRGVRALTRTG